MGKGSALLQMDGYQNTTKGNQDPEEDVVDDVDEPGCAECEGPKLCWFRKSRATGARGKGCNPDPSECKGGIDRARDDPYHEWVAYKCKSWTSCQSCSLHNGAEKRIQWGVKDGYPKYTPGQFCYDCYKGAAALDCSQCCTDFCPPEGDE